MLRRIALMPLVFVPLALGACTYTVPFVVAKSEPVYDVGGRPIAKDKRLVVLSPRSAQQVSGGLTGEAVDGRSTAGKTAAGVQQTTDYSVAAVTAEKALLHQGFRVIDQANLFGAMADPTVRQALVEARRSGGATLLSEALLLGKAVKADAALLIRAVKLYWSPYTVATLPNLSLAGCSKNVRLHQPVAKVDMVVVNIHEGEVLWSGSIELRGADLLDKDWTATHSYHPCDRSKELTWRFDDSACDVCVPNSNRYNVPLSESSDGQPTSIWLIESAVRKLVTRLAAAQ